MYYIYIYIPELTPLSIARDIEYLHQHLHGNCLAVQAKQDARLFTTWPG